MKFQAHKNTRSKLAISAILGAILMTGVTLAVGFGVWAWARTAATNSELNFGNAVGSNLNYLKENFEIINANFSSSATQNVTLWFYNPGNTTVYIAQIIVSNVSSTSPWTATNQSRLSQVNSNPSCGYCLKLPVGKVTLIQLKEFQRNGEEGEEEEEECCNLVSCRCNNPLRNDFHDWFWISLHSLTGSANLSESNQAE